MTAGAAGISGGMASSAIVSGASAAAVMIASRWSMRVSSGMAITLSISSWPSAVTKSKPSSTVSSMNNGETKYHAAPSNTTTTIMISMFFMVHPACDCCAERTEIDSGVLSRPRPQMQSGLEGHIRCGPDVNVLTDGKRQGQSGCQNDVSPCGQYGRWFRQVR